MTEIYRRHRHPTDYPAKVDITYGQAQATIIDINQGGARLQGLINVQRGDRITMNVLNQRITAEIRWHRRDRTGIQFTMPLATAIVDTVRQSSSRTIGWRHTSSHLMEMR